MLSQKLIPVVAPARHGIWAWIAKGDTAWDNGAMIPCRRLAIVLAIWSVATGAVAQSREAASPIARPAEAASSLTSVSTDEIVDAAAAPLAASRNGQRILSKNELYNLGRAAERRLGVRLGNDMSYRVTGN